MEPYLHRINDTARRAFAGMVTAVDEGIGNITKALEEKKMLANSVARHARRRMRQNLPKCAKGTKQIQTTKHAKHAKVSFNILANILARILNLQINLR